MIYLAVFLSSDGDPLVLALMGFAAGIYGFYHGFNRLKLKRVIENTPTSKIRSLAMGLVEIRGKAVCRKSLLSPLEKKPCVYFKWTLERWEKRGKHSKWVTIGKGESSEPFYLEDDTGRTIVFPTGAEMNLKIDYRKEFGGFGSVPAELQSFLDQNDVTYRGLFGLTSRMRFTEIFVVPGNIIYLLGSACSWQKKNRRMSESPDQVEMLMKEMEIQDNECSSCIRKVSDQPWFYISDSSEKDIISSLGWWVPLSIIGGPVLSAASLIYILHRFGVFGGL